jgi:hypothetical protein
MRKEVECLIALLVGWPSDLSHLVLQLVYFIVHPLDFAAVILPETSQFKFKFIDFFVLALLALDKDHWVIEPFLHEVLAIVFTHHFDLAAEFIIRTFNQLKLANFLVLLHVLSQSSLAALVVALNNLEQASFIVCS